MKIPQIDIQSNQMPIAGFSSKVVADVDEYLATKGFQLDDLNRNQQNYILKYFQGKRRAKWAVPFLILSVVTSAVAAYISYEQISSAAAKFSEQFPKETIAWRSDSTKVTVPIDPKIIETYGKMKFLAGFTVGFMCLIATFSLMKTAGCIVKISTKDELLEVFLSSLTEKTHPT